MKRRRRKTNPRMNNKKWMNGNEQTQILIAKKFATKKSMHLSIRRTSIICTCTDAFSRRILPLIVESTCAAQQSNFNTFWLIAFACLVEKCVDKTFSLTILVHSFSPRRSEKLLRNIN